MGTFNLDDYSTVEERLVKFWEDHPLGRIETSIYHYSEDRVVFKAEVWFEEWSHIATTFSLPVASGFAEEIRNSTQVNKTSFVENAETSAIGRALANCGYAGKKRPSREEMEKVERNETFVPTVKSVEDVKDAEWVAAAFPGSKVNTEEHIAEVLKAALGPMAPSSTPTIKAPGDPASAKQLGMIHALANKRSLDNDALHATATAQAGRNIEHLTQLTKGEASKVIGVLK